MIERSHASTKQALKIETGERRSLWQKYASIAVLNYNTSYHTSIGCEPSRVFLGRILYNVLDLILGFRPKQKPNPTSQIALDTLYQTELIYRDVRQNAKQAYVKFKAFLTKKPTLQNSKNQIMCMFCSRKQIINGLKFFLRNSVGLGRILLKSVTKQ